MCTLYAVDYPCSWTRASYHTRQWRNVLWRYWLANISVLCGIMKLKRAAPASYHPGYWSRVRKRNFQLGCGKFSTFMSVIYKLYSQMIYSWLHTHMQGHIFTVSLHQHILLPYWVLIRLLCEVVLSSNFLLEFRNMVSLHFLTTLCSLLLYKIHHKAQCTICTRFAVVLIICIHTQLWHS